jgi:co-chaperonin GroES (HSP10)
MLKVVGHRILILPDEIEKQTQSGILIVPNEKLERAAMDRGTIVGIGQNAWKAFDDGEPWASVGDKIYYARHSGRFVKDMDTDVEYVLINDEDVQVVIK